MSSKVPNDAAAAAQEIASSTLSSSSPCANQLYRVWEAIKLRHPGSRFFIDRYRGGCQADLISYLAHLTLLPDEDAESFAPGQLYTAYYHASEPIAEANWPFGHQEHMLMGGSGEVLRASKVTASLSVGGFDVTYKDTPLRVYKMAWNDGGGEESAYFLVWQGASDKLAKDLLISMHRWHNELKDEVWVFSANWHKDKGMFKSIQAARESDLVLPKDLLARLRRDTVSFFENEKLYREIGAPWKRGIMLLGPPGNGKTATIALILKSLPKVAILYVKSIEELSSMGLTTQLQVRAIFQKARETAPCILVLEDLDSLIAPDKRSFFLNEVDGLESNHGILIIATTNHAEKIDDALIKRPSRFDSKYTFDLPNEELRRRYVLKWLTEKLKPDLLTFSNEQVVAAGAIHADVRDLKGLAKAAAEETDGFSFATLKELGLVFLLSRASGAFGSDPTAPTHYSHFLAQIPALREQFKADAATNKISTDSEMQRASNALEPWSWFC